MKVLIFHGWGASSRSNWFPWLKNELEKQGIQVNCPDMPSSRNPKQGEWLRVAKSFGIDEETILVGHSLGTVLSMRLMQEQLVKAAFLVSALHRLDADIPALRDFFTDGFDFKKIKKNHIQIFNSDDDPFIPLSLAEELSKHLDCKLEVFHNKEHLNMGTDRFKFPELLASINEVIQAD